MRSDGAFLCTGKRLSRNRLWCKRGRLHGAAEAATPYRQSHNLENFRQIK
jgi:hypothetical protein